MMYISVLFIVIVSFSSYISRRISFMSLVFLLPFYTISREILSSGLVVLIWPYIWISALALVTIIKSKNINNKYPIYLIVLTLLITILSLLLVSKGFSRIHTENITFIFSKVELVLLVSFALFYFLLFIRGFFLEIKSSGKSVTYLDWIILVFFLYGFAHIYLTLIKDRDIFNAILGFRYYFSSAIVYFLARILVVNKKEISIIFFIMLAAIGLAIIFMFFESVFLNMLKIDSARLPWNRGILSEVFNYSPSQITFLDAYGGAPQGVMFMTHLSGVFSLFGFALLLPFFYSLDKIQDNRYRAFIILFILFAPLSFIYTSKTTIILYYLVIVVTAFFQFKYWKKSLWIVPLFAILVPIIYSYNLLPGMKYDFGRAISYIVSPQTATNQIIDEFNEDIIIKEKQNAGFFYKGNNNNRVLNNAFFYLRNSILSDILINRSDIFLNALCVPLLKPECAIPDSVFNLPVYLIVSSNK